MFPSTRPVDAKLIIFLREPLAEPSVFQESSSGRPWRHET